MKTHSRIAAGALLAMMAATGTLPFPAAAQTSLLERDVEFGTAANESLTMDVYGPDDGEIHPAILLLHPGGFVGGDKTDADIVRVAEFYAQNGYAVFSANYRSAREGNPYPALVEDAREAVAFIRANADRFDANPDRIAAFGASSGGTLAASVGLEGEGPLNQGTRVAAVVSWSGVLDLAATAEYSLAEQDGGSAQGLYTYMTGEAGQRTFRNNPQALAAAIQELKPRLQAASPITHVDPTDPPVFIANGASRDFVPGFQAQSMADALTQAGVPNELFMPSEGHALAYTNDALEPTLAFLDDHFVAYQPEAPGDGSSASLLRRAPLWAILAVATVVALLVLLLISRRRKAAYRNY
jgi:acetyl esterase